MKRHSIIALAVVSAAGALFTACSSDYTSSTPSITSLAGLPAATGPVTASRANALTEVDRSKTLSTWTTGWDGTKSGPMCQTGEMIMRLLSDASSPDKILCYVGAMEAAGYFTASYDGSNKYYLLSGMGPRSVGSKTRPAGDMTIKFNITKTGNSITDFKMWMCETTRGKRAINQSEYVATSLTGGVATVTSVGKFSGIDGGDSYSGSQRTVATGNFNSSGSWTSKTITNTGSFTGTFSASTYEHNQQLSLTQGTDNFVLSGYFDGDNNGNSQTGQIYSKVAGVNLANLTTAALGDGSAKYSFTFGGGGGGSFTDTKSWQGSDQTSLTPASDGTYYSVVSSATLPTAEAITAPDFVGSEIWNCDTTGQTVETIDMAAAMAAISAEIAACDTKYSFNNNSPAGCYNASFAR